MNEEEFIQESHRRNKALDEFKRNSVIFTTVVAIVAFLSGVFIGMIIP